MSIDVRARCIPLFALLVAGLGAAPGGRLFAEDSAAPKPGKEQVETYRFGVEIKAVGIPCRAILATLPVPTDWPEQTVTVLGEEKSRHVTKVEYRLLSGGAKQMRVTIPTLPAGAEAKVTVTYQVRRHTLLKPEGTADLLLPKASTKLRSYLAPSPYIESTDEKIRSLAGEVTLGKELPWQRAEAIYDCVRAKVKYQNGPLKGALAALNDGTGDCEELTSLFIALCRADKIPARTVWVPGHCYPEFYLEDKSGDGHWFPCQAAGTRAFGGIPELRPILQKGDNFRVPENRNQPQRYVTQFLTARSGRPTVKFIQERVSGG